MSLLVPILAISALFLALLAAKLARSLHHAHKKLADYATENALII